MSEFEAHQKESMFLNDTYYILSGAWGGVPFSVHVAPRKGRQGREGIKGTRGFSSAEEAGGATASRHRTIALPNETGVRREKTETNLDGHLG